MASDDIVAHVARYAHPDYGELVAVNDLSPFPMVGAQAARAIGLPLYKCKRPGDHQERLWLRVGDANAVRERAKNPQPRGRKPAPEGGIA